MVTTYCDVKERNHIQGEEQLLHLDYDNNHCSCCGVLLLHVLHSEAVTWQHCVVLDSRTQRIARRCGTCSSAAGTS